MDLDSLDDDDAAQLAERIGPHLDPGSYGDRVVLTKRQFVAAATGVAGAGALATWGVDDATAQAAGSVGTASSPVDVNAYDVDVANGVAMNGNPIENAGSVSADEIKTTPAGVTLTKSSNQPVDSGAIDVVTWDTADERNPNAPDFADLSNNRITIPSDEYSVAMISASIGTANQIAWEFAQIQKNQSSDIGVPLNRPGGTNWRTAQVFTAWIDISSGDNFRIRFSHSDGATQDIESANANTWFSIVAL